MSSFAIEDVVIGHPRFRAAGAAAAWLWTMCGTWSTKEGTDGFVPDLTVRAFGTVAQAERLVEVELWERVDGGYRFLRWRNGHGSTETVDEERRRKEREKKARYRSAQRQLSTKRVDSPAKVSTRLVDGTVDSPVDMSTDVHQMSTDVHRGLDMASSLEVPPPNPPQGEDHTTKPKRGTVLPDSWKPTDRHRVFAAANRLDLDATVVDFRNHHLFRGTVGKDWDRGFDTWLRNAVKFRAVDAAKSAKPKTDPDAWMNR